MLEPNTVLIYPITGSSHTFTETVPHNLVIYLDKDNKVTWINKGVFTATVYDVNGTWSTGKISPSMQKSIQFNSTGFYDYQVDTTYQGTRGDIVAISNETNSLPIDIRMKMGMSIVSGYLGNNPELIGVGIGDLEKGVMITINQEELRKQNDSESFYYNKYKNSQMTVRTLGGKTDKYWVNVSFSPTFEIGEKILIFVSKEPGSEMGDNYFVLAQQLGKYKIDGNKAYGKDHENGIDLDQFIREIHSTLPESAQNNNPN